MAAKKGATCVNCGEKAEIGVLDAYARFWCEECVIWILAETTPKKG